MKTLLGALPNNTSILDRQFGPINVEFISPLVG